MSYFNWLNLQYVDLFAEKIATVDRENELEAYLATIGVHSDVAKDLSQLANYFLPAQPKFGCTRQ